jgi:hypothetical protein
MSLSLTLSDRLHEILRQSSIRTVPHALVELITNADDAYSNAKSHRRDIIIDVDRQSTHTYITVIDQACGMTLDDMKKKLLVVGDYTATDSSRGMMGRGAKDCTFLGDITFTCIKEGKISALVIYQNRKADIVIEERDVTIEDREKYEISKNGCHVCLKTLPSLVESNETVMFHVSQNIYLRNILQSIDTIVLFRDKKISYINKLEFKYGPRHKIISCDYDIPEYNTTAHFELYRHDSELPYPHNPELMTYGVLVGSSHAIYECSALYHIANKTQDYLWNPNLRYITGSLTCDHIDIIARDAANGNLSDRNPFLIIDSNRRHGLALDHPFTKALYSHAYQLLEIVMGKIQDIKDDQLVDFTNGRDVFDSLSDMISSMLPQESVLYTWRTKDDHTNLVNISSVVKNVDLDSSFLGLTWEEIQKLSNDQYVQIQQDNVNKTSFKLSFSTDPKILGSYQLLYLPGTVTMKINAADPSIREYISVEDNRVELVNVGKALTSVGNILIEATNNMILRRKIMAGQTSSLNLDSFNELLFVNNAMRSNIGSKIFDRVHTGISELKSGTSTTSLTV